MFDFIVHKNLKYMYLVKIFRWFQAEGGGQTYTWTSDLSEAVTLGKVKEAPKEAMVSNDNAGVFHTTASGAVSFKVRATTANSETNFDEAQVRVLLLKLLPLTDIDTGFV